MSSVGWATLQVIPSLRGLDQSVLRQLGAQAGNAGGAAGQRFGDEFSRRASSSVSSVGDKLKAIAKGSGYVALAAVGAGGALTGFGIKGAAALETTTTSFTALLGSTQAATAQIKLLQQYAAKTPFSQQDVLGYAQQYYALAGSVGLSKDNVTQFLDAIGNLGAVTGASTQNIHNAVMAIGQIGSSGRVTLENLNQISEAFPGFNGAAAIAAATGQKTADVMKEISAGTLDAKTGVSALLLGMQQFQGAAGAMGKQAETLTGLFSTFKDTISIQLTKAFQPLVPTIKSSLAEITPLIASTLSTLAPTISSFVQGLAPIIGPLIQGLGESLGAVFQALGPALSALTPSIKPLADAFVQLVNAAAPFLKMGAEIAAVVAPALARVLSVLAPILVPLTVAFIAYSAAVRIAAAATLFFNLVLEVNPIVAVATALIALGAALVYAYKHSKTFRDIVAAIGDSLKLLWDIVVKVVQVALAPFVAYVKFVIGVLEHLWGLVVQITGALTDFAQKVGNALGLTGLPLDDLIRNAQTAAGAMTVSMSVAVGAVQSLTQAIAEAASGASGLALAIAGGIHGTAANRLASGVKLPKGNLASLIGGSIEAGPGIPGPKFDPATLTRFRQSLLKTAADVRSAYAAIVTSARAAGKSIPAFIGRENTQLLAEVNRRVAIANRLARANDALKAVQARFSEARSGVASAISGSFDITTAGQQKQIFNDRAAPAVSAASILAQLKATVAKARTFATTLRSLAAKGLPQSLLQQLALAGPDALEQAKALAAATPGQLASIKSSYKSLTSIASSAGTAIATDLYGAGVQSAKGLVAGLKSQESALTAAVKALGEKMIAQLKSTLKISSPSRVMHEIGVFTGQGFERGIASRYDSVSKAGAMLGNSALPANQRTAGGLGGAGGQGGGNTWHLYEQSDPVATANAVIRRQQMAGMI